MQDGLIISNASSVSARSLSDNVHDLFVRHMVVDTIALLCLCSIGIFRQRINLRILMLLHRTQLSRSGCVSFYRIKALLSVLGISLRLLLKAIRSRHESNHRHWNWNLGGRQCGYGQVQLLWSGWFVA